MAFNDDDKTLNDLLSSLHSTKVRRMHKYTDEQLSLCINITNSIECYNPMLMFLFTMEKFVYFLISLL